MDRLTTVLVSFQDILSSDVLSSMSFLEPFRPLINEVLSALLGDVQSAKFADLVNATNIDSLLRNMFNNQVG